MSMTRTPSHASATTSSRGPTAATVPSWIRTASATGGSSSVTMRPTTIRLPPSPVVADGSADGHDGELVAGAVHPTRSPSPTSMARTERDRRALMRQDSATLLTGRPIASRPVIGLFAEGARLDDGLELRGSLRWCSCFIARVPCHDHSVHIEDVLDAGLTRPAV